MAPTWAPVAAPAAVALAVLLAPGLLVGRAAGLRGLLWWGAAPALSVTVVALAAVAAPAAGLAWGPLPVAAASVLAAAVAAAVGLLAGPWRGRALLGPVSARDAAVGAAAVAGLLLGVAVAGRRLLRAVAGPTGVSQSYDAVFHLNAVRRVVETGDGSSLHLGRLVVPDGSASFYPAAWHDVVALAASTAGAGVDVASNATALVVALVVWPLGVVALVRALLGPRPLALAAAGALTAAFTSQPLVPLEWGVLYPTLLTNSVLPATLALLVLAADRARAPRRRVAALLTAAATLPGMALAQPSGGFALAAVLLPLAVVVHVRWLRRRWAAGARPVAVVSCAAVVAAAALAWHAVDTSASVVSARRTDWEAEVSWLAAAKQAVLLSYLSHTETVRPPLWAAAVLVLAGAVVALRRPRLRWVVAAHVLVSALYVLAWGVDSPLSQTLTGFWYNDAYRLAGLPVVTGVVLASAACAVLPEAVRRRARWVLRGRTALRRRVAGAAQPLRWPVLQVAGALVVGLVVVAAARGGGYRAGYDALAANYANSPDTVLSDVLDADERALLDRLDAEVPPGQTVAGNPWNGSALVYALADRATPFPHMTSTFDEPRQVVAASLRDAAGDPAVCPAVRALHLGWVLDFGPYHLWGGDPAGRDAVYPGLEGLGAVPGFEVADRQGDAVLYRVTACGDVGAGPIAGAVTR